MESLQQRLCSGFAAAALQRRLCSGFAAAALQRLCSSGFAAAALQQRLCSGFAAAALQRSQAPGTPVHRSRSVEPPFKVGKKTSQEVHHGTSSGEAHKQADVERMTLQELYESSSRGERAHQKSGTKRENKIPEGTQDAKKAHVGDERTQVTSTSSNSVPTSGERYEGLDLSRFLAAALQQWQLCNFAAFASAALQQRLCGVDQLSWSWLRHSVFIFIS